MMARWLLTFILVYSFQYPLQAMAGTASLNITPQQGNGTIEGENNFHFFVSELVDENGQNKGLHNVMGSQGELGSALEINIYTPIGQSQLDIPEAVTQRLLSFLERGPVPYNFCDCHCFGAFLGGLPYPHGSRNGELIPAQFPGVKRTQINSEAVLKPGDVVLLAETIDENSYKTNHTAVYLGEGLYISKLGGTGGFVVTNLTEISKAYNTDIMFLMESESINQSPSSEELDQTLEDSSQLSVQ